MKNLGGLLFFTLICVIISSTYNNAQTTTKSYDPVTLTSSGTTPSGNFPDVWDLTQGDLTLTFTVNLTGVQDDAGAHAWAEFGIRSCGFGNFNPTWQSEGAGVWLATDYDWTVNTFDPDPVGAPSLDLDDKLILQKGGGTGEGYYNLPSTPPAPGSNHRFWFDRDGYDQWQAQSPLAINGQSYNTNGIYNIVITLHSTNATNGTAYMKINSLDQGFETDGNWNTMELTPAGMTFTGDMTKMLVFYGLYGYGATHSVTFSSISISGYHTGLNQGSVDAGEDVTVYYGYQPLACAQLNAVYTPGECATGNVFSWTPTTGLSDPAIANPDACPSVTTTYTVTVTGNGVTVSDQVTVYVEDVTCGNNSDKVAIYHNKGDGEYIRICISPNAIEQHLAHGDVWGIGKDGSLINEAPDEFKLSANYPNPFNPATKISYQVPVTSEVDLSIFNSLGEKVAELVNGIRETGYYEVEWNASNMPSGIYFYSIKAGEFISIQKMILLK